MSCHVDLSALMLKEGAFVHKPVLEGECGACHKAHGSNERRLLTSSGSAICAGCHKPGDDKKFSEAHGGISTKGADCTGCHQSHAGDDKRLLHLKKHEPFEKGDCMVCHKRL